MKQFFKSFLLTLILIVFLFLGSTLYFILKNHVEKPGDFFKEIISSNDNITFLLLGVDSLNIDKAQNTRSDTIMLVNVNLESGKVNLISIPRDTYANIEGHGKQKINHSYNYGGADLTLSTVNNLLGTNIENYIAVDYKFVKDIVNIIGGVNVDVPMDMDYEDLWADPPLKIHLKQGMQKLKGDEAIQFLRFRKGYKNQDLGRVQAQQQFVSSFIQKAKSPATFVKFPIFLRSYDKYTKSNIPFSKIVKIGLNVRKYSAENIETMTVPGNAGYKNKISYFFVDKNEMDAILVNLGLK
ncbi:LCP family protein [Peptoniphilus sp. oral taxon 386]|uniref:LCP family protein n=1 Tax=Peptoniphilus sp. oral taxon 386 TaxID=652713 RepID=UPI0001DA9C8B|nr:LCP family protein [Peptoniphilus sp. oral taxon 386]EFI42427.1 cell envelope-like function transcriptional attenuator common domain protein [Peptoniphilus sp. oral taxon 386 str. F0131]